MLGVSEVGGGGHGGGVLGQIHHKQAIAREGILLQRQLGLGTVLRRLSEV